MPLRNRFVLAIILSSLAALAGCGSSSGSGSAPPTGGFSDSNLSGTYVFSTTGSDSTTGELLAVTGSFTADGKGGISGGTMDINDPAIGVAPAQAITAGSYSVGADGRPSSGSGLITLTSAAGTFNFDFVLTSSEGGLITEFDSNGSGSGTLELQTTVAQSSINGQSYVFNFSGTSTNGTGAVCGNGSVGGTLPFATVGAFTVDSSGNITGIEDVNSNCVSLYGTSGTAITGGSINLGTVPGTATITTAGNTYSFDVYPVSPTELKFIEIDSLPVVSGEVFSQSSSIPTGNNVFAVAGFDIVVGSPFTSVGLLVTDGAGNITTSSVQDINDAGTAFEVPGFSGGYSTLTGGRSLITMNGFVKGDSGSGCSSCQFAVYPSSGGLQILEVDGGGATDGVAYLQGGSPSLASGQGYGMNLTGFNFNSDTEEDDIAEFTNTSGTFSPGKIDVNDEGSTSFGNSFSSTYSADSTVSGRGTVAAGSNSYDLITYVVNGGAGTPTAVAIDSDGTFVSLGLLGTQTASASSNAATRHLKVLSLKPGTKPKALKRRQQK
ncbi:MAG TPA: hypothetical protein VGM18_15695 [Candidatus Sulfotelmatobacter sp.]|jgi:hypothetical protein